MKEILQYLRLKGEQLDQQIAEGMSISLPEVRRGLAELNAKRELITCQVTRFDNGRKVQGTLYRASAYMPPPAPGRKSKAQKADMKAIEDETPV